MIRPKLESVDIWNDKEYINYSYAFDEDTPYFNFTVDVLKELPDVEVHFDATFHDKDNMNHYFSLNTTYNLCKVFDYKEKSTLGLFIWSFLNEHGSLPAKCPVPAVR